MKKLTFLAVLFSLVHSSLWSQQAGIPKSGDWALGLIVGSITGLSVKHWTAPKRAIVAGLGVPFDSDARFHFHGDYIWHAPLKANVRGELPFYIGVGGRLRFLDKLKNNSTVEFGMRIPIGLEFLPREIPLDFFAEIVPVIVFTSGSRAVLDGGVGVRYYFN